MSIKKKKIKIKNKNQRASIFILIKFMPSSHTSVGCAAQEMFV